MASITVDKIRKDFGSFRALDEVSLIVEDQSFVVLLGPSGCGKTTLLRIIAGLETQTSGRILIGERDVSTLPPRHRRLAMVFQNYAVFPHITVADNIGFGLKMRGADPQLIQRKVRETADLMHIEKLLERYPAQLSGGQRQRVAVARALAVEPEVLLMDEPLSNLDALLRLEMRAELKGLLQRSRTTTVFVTHDQVEAMSLADRIAVMHGGRIVQYDRPIAVYQDPANTFVGSFIGNPPMNFLRAKVTAAGGSRVVRVGAFELPAPPAAAGNEIILGMRPEDLDVVAPGQGFDATVAVVEPLGPHVLVTARVEEQMIRVTAPPDLAAGPGDRLSLRPNLSRLRWLDAERGEALR